MRLAVEQELGFTVSAGIASNKVLAKLASSMNKPNKQVRVTPWLQLSYRCVRSRVNGAPCAIITVVWMALLATHTTSCRPLPPPTHAAEPKQMVDLAATGGCSVGVL